MLASDRAMSVSVAGVVVGVLVGVLVGVRIKSNVRAGAAYHRKLASR